MCYIAATPVYYIPPTLPFKMEVEDFLSTEFQVLGNKLDCFGRKWKLDHIGFLPLRL